MQTSSSRFDALVAGNAAVVEQRVTVQLPTKRTNLCACPSFESGIATSGGGVAGTWSSFGGSSLGDVTPDRGSAVGSLALTAHFAGSAGLTGIEYDLATRVGSSYVASVYLNPSVDRSFGLSTVGSASDEEPVVPVVASVVGAFTRVYIRFVATSELTTVCVVAYDDAFTGDIVSIDAMLIECDTATPTPGSYFDGSFVL